MATRDLVIGIDSSTTACKAIAWDMHGNPLATGRAPLPMHKPRPSWHEQPAESWWTAMVQALRDVTTQIDPARLAAVCITTQRETFVLTDQAGQPLQDALLWMDERCREELPEIERLYGKERIHQETGKPLSANLSLGKLYWLRKHQPELFEACPRVLDVHAYLAYRLAGRFATSWGCADPMGLFDMRRNGWNDSLIEAIGLRVEQFPDALPVGSVIGEILPDAAETCGLPAGLPLVAGLGDGQAAGLGVGAARPGEAYLNLGTAVVSGTYSDHYLTDLAFRTMSGGVPGTYSLETVLLGGTYTISWFVENYFRPDAASRLLPEDALEEAAARVPPGAMGLTLVPYWNSAMNPYWDASASGIVVGWRGVHQPVHLYRAILEGIAFEQRLATEGVESALRIPVSRYIAVGGGARSRLWRQIIADVTGRPVYHAAAPEASALGAGILAAVGGGLFASVLDAALAMAQVNAQPEEPDPQRHKFYTRLYEEVYRQLFPALQPSLNRLANLNWENYGLSHDKSGNP
jgi:sugar (pentulose or hexulose) kinase